MQEGGGGGHICDGFNSAPGIEFRINHAFPMIEL